MRVGLFHQVTSDRMTGRGLKLHQEREEFFFNRKRDDTLEWAVQGGRGVSL